MGARNYDVDFPTLWVLAAWHEHHCIIPDGFRKGTPWQHYDWQLWITANHYRVDPDAVPFDAEGYPTRAAAFHNRRSQVVAAQKTGKGPFAAVIVCGEAVGPALFAGWASAGDLYRCEDHGCSCGWVYAYDAGEAMGMPWPTPLIQLLATSEDQVDNVYRPLQAMARGPLLSELMQVREGFVRLRQPDGSWDGRIDVVTSSAQSRLGNPITFALQDETQLYTQQNKLVKVAETMRRGLAGMGGRSMETTNAWDPAEKSVAQRTYEAKAADVFKFFESPPADLKWSRREDRLKILDYNYAGSPHVPVAQVLAEAEELAETDPAQAERFYGNRIVAGLGSWLDGEAWDARKAPAPKFARRTQVVLGFDGSDSDDWTGIRAETRDGFQFTPTTSGGPTIWNPADYDGKVPRLDVAAAVAELFETFDVVRMYCDPPYWTSEIDAWAEQHGKERVLRWETFQPKRMHAAAERLVTDVNKRDSGFSHDGCDITAAHVRNARRASRNPPPRYVLTKPGDGRKIDLAVCSILAHEAAGDVTAAKLWRRKSYTYFA
ncbi:hypothetical protein [Nocardioides sp.]|uniref:hypothetical protein n=1 Tax=Nocardioides sp. TaxID=35761 RepID=UPI0035193677